MELHRVAKELETAINKEEKMRIPSLLERFAATLANVLQGITPLLENGPTDDEAS
jgi:hypothetical protein